MSVLDEIEPRCMAIAYAMEDSQERDAALLEAVGECALKYHREVGTSMVALSWLLACRAACGAFNRRMRHLVGHHHMLASQHDDGTVTLYFNGGLTRNPLDKRPAKI